MSLLLLAGMRFVYVIPWHSCISISTTRTLRQLRAIPGACVDKYVYGGSIDATIRVVPLLVSTFIG